MLDLGRGDVAYWGGFRWGTASRGLVRTAFTLVTQTCFCFCLSITALLLLLHSYFERVRVFAAPRNQWSGIAVRLFRSALPLEQGGFGLTRVHLAQHPLYICQACCTVSCVTR